MNPFGNDLVGGFNIATLALPAARAATANLTGIDCKDYDGPLTAIVHIGVWTDGAYLFSLEESTDDSTYTSITPLEGSFSSISSTATDETIQKVQFKRSKRYVRLVITETSAGSTGIVCSSVVLGRKKNV